MTSERASVAMSLGHPSLSVYPIGDLVRNPKEQGKVEPALVSPGNGNRFTTDLWSDIGPGCGILQTFIKPRELV